jgi:Fe-S oxidoreductase
MKAEFLQHYYDANGTPLRTKMIAYITSLNRLGSIAPKVFNFFLENVFVSGIIKKLLGFAPKRRIPLLFKTTLLTWAKRHPQQISGPVKGKVWLFADEFSNFNDVEIGIKAIKLLNAFGFEVKIPRHLESGRTFLSKGLLRKAKKIAEKNVLLLKDIITEETPLIGIEPSAILTFRDEYPELVNPALRPDAKRIAPNALMFDEFITRQGIVNPGISSLFTKDKKNIRLHGHCHQKVLASVESTKKMLSIPENYNVEEIKSGCCGMAGAFGYEKEHYDVSMKIGELVLFPDVRNSPDEVIIAAPGTSCRHQIKDGTGRTAYHPIEILYDSLVS